MSTNNALAFLALVSVGVYTLMRSGSAVAYPLGEENPLNFFDVSLEGGPVLPRGIRNNNPGNIRYTGTAWQGLDNPPSDGEYCRFTDAVYGVRAMARVLASYRRRGLVTIRGIISTWAPNSENQTDSYIYSVSQRLGRDPDAVLYESDYPALIEAIIYHENGQQPYAMGLIREGVALA